jgi:Flp pilus assembly protein TadD
LSWVLLTFVLAAQTNQIQSALNLAKEHRYKEANATLKGVAPPTDRTQQIAFHRLKAAIASGLSDTATSAKEMEAALELAPEDPNLLHATGVAEAQAGLLDPALAHLEQARQSKDSAPLENLIGDIQEKLGNNVAAVKSYQAAVQLAPSEEEYRFALGLELLRHQTFDPAILVFEQGVKDFPRSTRMRMALAVAYFLVEREADASQTLIVALRLDPDSALAAGYLGEMQLSQTASPDPAAVQELCRFADAHPKSGHAQAICGGLLLRQGPQAEPALSRLRTAVRLAPDEPIARCNLGKALEQGHNWAGARTQMEQCARLQPDSPEAHYRLARIYRNLGLPDLAKQQEQLRAEADRRKTAENDRGYAALTRFIYTLDSRGLQPVRP